MRMRNVLFSMIALAAGSGADVATAQNSTTFVVDGDWRDWGGGPDSLDGRNDVVPDTNSTVDLRGYEFGGGRIFYLDGASGEASDTLFTFLFRFLAPPFQGTEETTVELFFDMSQSDTYGEPQQPWSDFRPDYVAGVTGSNGALTKEFYWRYTGSGWDKKEGADIPELDVAASGKYVEGAMDWKLLDIPDTDLPYYEVESYNSLKAVRISKGVFRDYVPDRDQTLRQEQVLPQHWTHVESDSWGRIKQP